MKTQVKKIDGATCEMNIEVGGEVVKNKFEDVFKRISKDAKVPGFRPGHAPRDVLEKHYSAEANQQVIRELVPDVYNEAIEKEKLDVIELPDISEVKLEGDTLSFKAKVEVSPEINLKNYKGLKANYKKIEVTAEEVKKNLDSIREARKAEKLDDTFARGLGYPGLSELEKAVEKQIYIQKDNLQRQKIEHELIEALMKDLDFKAPQSLVRRQLEELTRQAKLDLALKGIPRDKIDEQANAMSQELDPEARKQVRVYLVLAAVAARENIPKDDHMAHKVMELLLKEAKWQEAAS